MKPLTTHDRQGVQELTSLSSPPVLIFLSIHTTTAPVAVCPLLTHLLSGTVFALTALSRTSPLCAHAGEWGGVCLERDWCLCMSCTDNNHKLYSNTNTMWICVTEISSTMYNANTCKSTGWKLLLFFISLIHYESRASWQPKALLLPPQGVKSCHLRPSMSCVCVCVCLDGCFQQRQHNIAAPPTNHLSRPNQYTSAEIIHGIEQRVNLRCCQFIAGFICCRFSLPLLLR